ncbi:MAG: MotA/TolQ/ExbB proton channel family protein [Deltaproteobacteria bacterium]|jgi:biopolymer transport protein ExbB/TolQ|nr:MotA/TolQ/ExbB proton channel family protein [Deltaproteobacteria bacterium]
MDKFTFKNMFLDADPVVQGIMILLVLASFASWAVILEKAFIIHMFGRHVREFKKQATRVGRLTKPDDFPNFAALIVAAGVNESLDQAGEERRAAYRERAERAMLGVLSGLLDKLEARISLLATIGSTSPFVGLFGTVWGIMRSFIGIAASGETTLAVVAPGIAEALSATAMGLVAAIPAVIAYNKINSVTKKLAKEALIAIGLVSDNLARDRVLGRAGQLCAGF